MRRTPIRQAGALQAIYPNAPQAAPATFPGATISRSSPESFGEPVDLAVRAFHRLVDHQSLGQVLGMRFEQGWGFAKPSQTPHWFCFEHRAEGERFL